MRHAGPVVLILSLMGLTGCGSVRPNGPQPEAAATLRVPPTPEPLMAPPPLPPDAADGELVGDSSPVMPAAGPPDFEKHIRPLLEARCSPCHFAGGKLYAKLPFDKERTIDDLGERLFTRIKNDMEQSLIRAWLQRPKQG